MKPGHLVIGALALLAALVVGLEIGLRGKPGPPDGKFALPGPEIDGTNGQEASEPVPTLEPVPAQVEEASEEPAREEIAPPQEAVTAIASPSPDSAPVHGLLTDSATGEPLPLYLLRIRDEAGRREDVSTDERGRFATGAPMRGGTLHIVPLDDPRHRRPAQEIARERSVQSSDAPDIDLSVPSGPTYRFAIAPPGAVEATELSARLRVASIDDRRSLDPELLRAPASGDAPWVRFVPVPEEFDRAEAIELASRDGLWAGEGKASIVRGIAPGIVDVVLEARAVLQGKLVDTGGGAVEGASVVFDGTTVAGRPMRRATASGKDGSFRFDFLREGNGTVSVRSLRHAPQDAAVRLLATNLTTQDLLLQPLPPAGAIRGRLESETGTYNPGIEVVLRPIASAALSGGGPREATARVRWEEAGGRQFGRFEFEGLPAGKYELAVRDNNWFPWEPRSVTVSPPSEETRFLAHDDIAHAVFAFRARDADAGARLDGFFASIEVKGGPAWSRRLSFEDRALVRFPLERSFRWRLDQEGYRPAFGNEKAFAVEEMRGGRVWRFAEIDLKPGWGEVFKVVRRGNNKPIQGAKVLLDGREAGTTQGDGTVAVEARDRPGRVEVVYRDWRTSGPVDLRPPWRRREKRFVLLSMVPPAPR
jgi:hypothetical protein